MFSLPHDAPHAPQKSPTDATLSQLTTEQIFDMLKCKSVVEEALNLKSNTAFFQHGSDEHIVLISKFIFFENFSP